MIGEDPVQGAFELSYVVGHGFRNRADNLWVKGDPAFLTLHFKDRDAGFKVRRRNIGDHPPLKTGNQAIFNGRNRLGRPVGADDDLFIVLMERVESVEKFFLCLFFTGDELNIVDKEDVDGSVGLFEFLSAPLFDSGYEVIGEFLAIHVHDLRAAVCF